MLFNESSRHITIHIEFHNDNVSELVPHLAKLTKYKLGINVLFQASDLLAILFIINTSYISVLFFCFY